MEQGDIASMSLDMVDAGLEQTDAQADLIEEGLAGQAQSAAPATKDLEREAKFERVRQLARRLALAHGEDPDEQPFPLRHPRWRFHCARAKVLLSISEAEHQALAAVLGKSEERTECAVPDRGRMRFWSARRS
jgi:hypothetical protein